MGFSTSAKNAVRILTGIVLNPWIALDSLASEQHIVFQSMNIRHFTIYLSLLYFLSMMFYSFQCVSCSPLIRLTLKHFIILDAILMELFS